MAKLPTKAKIRANQNATDKAIEKKVEAQYKLGKEFERKAYGPGVVPESKWIQAKKDGSDVEVPDYV